MRAPQSPLLLFLLTLLLISTPSGPAGAQNRRPASPSNSGFGLGAIVGDPTAITGKLFLSPATAVDGGFALAFDKWFLFYLDYLQHFPGALGRANDFVAKTTPYWGIGGLLVASNEDRDETRRGRYFSDSGSGRVALGMRVPLGLEWRPAQVSLGVFFEIAPGITIVPSTTGFFHAGIGARFYF